MKVAFYIENVFHHTILDPVHELLKRDFECLVSRDAEAVTAFAPRVIVMAGGGEFAHFRVEVPDALIVWTGHAYVSKNIRGVAVERCDFACMSGQYQLDEHRRNGWRPQLGSWVTGFVPIDGLVNAAAKDPRSVLPPSLRESEHILLYGPTYNTKLTSSELLGPEWAQQLCERFPTLGIVIKPHPSQIVGMPHCIGWWRRSQEENDRIWLMDKQEDDVFPVMAAANVLLTDAASLMMWYLLLDRPLILVNNPRRFSDGNAYDPHGPEWQWRDMGVEVDRPQDLPAALHKCLTDTAAAGERRREYRRRVLGDTADGKIAARVAGRIRALLQPTETDREWVDLAWDAHASLVRSERRGYRWLALLFAARLRRYRRLRMHLGQLGYAGSRAGRWALRAAGLGRRKGR